VKKLEDRIQGVWKTQFSVVRALSYLCVACFEPSY